MERFNVTVDHTVSAVPYATRLRLISLAEDCLPLECLSL